MNDKIHEMLKEAFPDGRATYDELKQWLANNGWEILTNCYDSVADLLSDVSEETYDSIVYDVVFDTYTNDGLVHDLACMELAIDYDEKEEE